MRACTAISFILFLTVFSVSCDSNGGLKFNDRPIHRGRAVSPEPIESGILSRIPRDGLLAFYTMDRNVRDYATGNHHGEIFGASYVSDRFGNPNSALQFDGVDDFIALDNSHLMQTELPISISYWVNLTQTELTQAAFTNNFNANSNSGVFATFDSHGGNPAFSFANGGRPGFQSRRTKHADVALDAHRWYHLAKVITGPDEIHIYVDGDEVDGRYDGGATWLAYTPGPAAFGKRTASFSAPPLFFSGVIDEFAFYNKELSPREVQQLFQAGEAR